MTFDPCPTCGHVPRPKYLKRERVEEILDVSKFHVYELIKRHGFPAPKKLGWNSRWIEDDVYAWLEARGQSVAERKERKAS